MAAIVCLQPDGGHHAVACEFLEQLGPGPGEGQDGLVGVADGEQLGVGAVVEAHGPDEPVEAGCQVLVLVHVQARVAGREHLADGGVSLDELDGEPYQLLEVDQPALLEFVFVPAGDLGDVRAGAAPLLGGRQTLPVDVDRGPCKADVATPAEHGRDGVLDDLGLLVGGAKFGGPVLRQAQHGGERDQYLPEGEGMHGAHE